MEESYVWNKDHCLKYWWSDSNGMLSWAAACKCSIKLLVIGIFGERLLCWAHLRNIKLCCHHMFVFGDKNKEINLCLFINLLLLCNKFRDFVTIFFLIFWRLTHLYAAKKKREVNAEHHWKQNNFVVKTIYQAQNISLVCDYMAWNYTLR